MLLARLLRSMVSRSREEVAPSTVKGALCLPTVSTTCGFFVHMQIEVGKPHVERIVALWIQLDLAMERELPEKRDARPDAQAPDVPFAMVALVGVDCREVVMEPPAQQHALHDRIRRRRCTIP